MTAAELVALITAVAGLVAAVTALIHSIQTRSTVVKAQLEQARESRSNQE